MNVLIYYNDVVLAPEGGPKGYLYGLKTGLDNMEKENISINFLHDENINKPNALVAYGRSTNNFLAKKIAGIFKIYYHHKRLSNIMKLTIQLPADLNSYDIIHFHSTREFYQCRESLKKFKGITVLTSHSPQPLSNELIEEAGKVERMLFKKEYSSLIEMDRYAFENADFILFPCEDADEAYYHQWQQYGVIKSKRKDSYRYLVTGTTPAQVSMCRNDVRNKLGIPHNAFVISYVGRHNEIKGYDRLKEIGQAFLEKHPDVYILVAGKETPMTGLKHPHWHEVGWTKEPHSYVNASDIFVLPNRETYFDLVLLEVLSVGKRMLISDTGGNRYFKKFEASGIDYFSNNDEALYMLEKNYNMAKEEVKKKEEMNKKIYFDNFTPDEFAKRYIEFYKQTGKKGK